MYRFFVEMEESTVNFHVRTKELIKQIESLEMFYQQMGFRSDNIRMIFNLTLRFLRNEISKLEVKSFFDTMMKQDKVVNEKEMKLLLCFDEVIESHDQEQQRSKLADNDSDFRQDIA